MLKNYLLEHWNQFIGKPVRSVFDILTITSCDQDYGNDLVLIFLNGDPNPDYVMKITRNKTYNFKLKNEYYALQTLKNTETLSSHLPYPHYLGEIDGKTFFIQSGVQGSSLSKYIRNNSDINSRILINKAVDTLITINASVSGCDPDHLYCKELFPEVFDKYRNNLIRHGIAPVSIEALKESCLNFFDFGRYYFLHGDYWQENIMTNNNDISGIIDWEFSMPRSSIPTDITLFLITLAFSLRTKVVPKTDILEAFKWAFFSKGTHNDLIIDCYLRYCAAFNLDKNLFTPLIKLTLVKMSIRELTAYGRHEKNDLVYIEILQWFLKNESRICLS